MTRRASAAVVEVSAENICGGLGELRGGGDGAEYSGRDGQRESAKSIHERGLVVPRSVHRQNGILVEGK